MKGAGRAVNNLGRDIRETMKREGHDNAFTAGLSVIGRNLSDEAKRNKEEHIGHQIGMPNVPGMGAFLSPITAVNRSVNNNADDSAYYERSPEYQQALRQNPMHEENLQELQRVREQDRKIDVEEEQRQQALKTEQTRGLVGYEGRREKSRQELEQQKTGFERRQKKELQRFKREKHTEAEKAEFAAEQEQAREDFQQNRRNEYKKLRITSPEEREELAKREQGILSTINSLELDARKAADEAMRNR